VSAECVKIWKKTIWFIWGVDKLKKASRISVWIAEDGAAELICSMEVNEIKLSRT
jgi:hypothetical protein